MTYWDEPTPEEVQETMREAELYRASEPLDPITRENKFYSALVHIAQNRMSMSPNEVLAYIKETIKDDGRV